jgi:hypothetical protein
VAAGRRLGQDGLRLDGVVEPRRRSTKVCFPRAAPDFRGKLSPSSRGSLSFETPRGPSRVINADFDEQTKWQLELSAAAAGTNKMPTKSSPAATALARLTAIKLADRASQVTSRSSFDDASFAPVGYRTVPPRAPRLQDQRSSTAGRGCCGHTISASRGCMNQTLRCAASAVLTVDQRTPLPARKVAVTHYPAVRARPPRRRDIRPRPRKPSTTMTQVDASGIAVVMDPPVIKLPGS